MRAIPYSDTFSLLLLLLLLINLMNSRLAPEISGGDSTPTFLREPLEFYGDLTGYVII